MANNLIQFEKRLSWKAFQKQYATEKQCSQALTKYRWQRGYHCPNCGYERYEKSENHKIFICQRCGHKTELLVLGVPYANKLPLKTLFLLKYFYHRIKEFLSTSFTRPAYSVATSILRRGRRAFREIYGAMISEKYSRLYINFNLPPHRWNAITKIHCCFSRIQFDTHRLYSLISIVAWPAKSVIFAIQRTVKLGPEVRQAVGVGLIRQLVDQIYLSIRYFVPPHAYYFFGLYDPTKRKMTSSYVQDHEIRPLLLYINSNNDLNIFNDKRRFFNESKKNELPVIPVVAEFSNGEMDMSPNSQFRNLPKVDLFAKPALGRCGSGPILYVYLKSNYYRSSGGFVLTSDQLLANVSECSRVEPYILQERILNASTLSGFSIGGLCTARVVTCHRTNDSFEHLVSIFKMPRGDCIVDNFTTGGIACPVDEKTGLLGAGTTINSDIQKFDRHPDTGEKIVGFKLPFWHEVIQLCLRAHRVFYNFAFVGWDVAFTDDGPVLVEANPEWGVSGLQKAHGYPLGGSNFPEIYLLHLQQLGRLKQGSI